MAEADPTFDAKEQSSIEFNSEVQPPEKRSRRPLIMAIVPLLVLAGGGYYWTSI